MATVTYLGPKDRYDGTEVIRIPGEGGRKALEFPKDVPVEDVPAAVVKRLEEFEGHHFDVSDSGEKPQLTGQALEDRVKELEIEGASNMSADEKREAVAEAEQGEGD